MDFLCEKILAVELSIPLR